MSEREHTWLKALVKASSRGMSAGEDADGSQTTLKVEGYEPFPACGFAWVEVKPATSAFAKFLVASGLALPVSTGGVQISVEEFGQDYALKLAYARAFADTLINELVLTQEEPLLRINAGGALD